MLPFFLRLVCGRERATRSVNLIVIVIVIVIDLVQGSTNTDHDRIDGHHSPRQLKRERERERFYQKFM